MEPLIFSALKHQNTKKILSLQNVDFSYHSKKGETKVLNNINISVRDGEFLSIVGPSGCGKSTLLNIICGLLTPEFGKLILEPDATIGYMLQHDHLFEWRTI